MQHFLISEGLLEFLEGSEMDVNGRTLDGSRTFEKCPSFPGFRVCILLYLVTSSVVYQSDLMKAIY
jgi:hypothetical protein